MSWSATEVSALASKAARGAGAPPAQADRFGRVAAIHLLRGQDAGLLWSALEALPAGPILAYPVALDRAVAAAGQGSGVVLPGVQLDALLSSYVTALPFLARIEVTENDVAILHVDLARPRPKGPPGRISGCADLLASMERLAAATFVPESEGSRQSGAGAGVSDND